MGRSTPPFPTTLRLNPNGPQATQKQIHLSTKLFSPAPILRFTVGKFSQVPQGDGPEVVVLGRSNVGVSSPPHHDPQTDVEIFLAECAISRGSPQFCEGIK